MSEAGGTMDGGCPCGRVRYRMQGDPITVNACHCRDCQKRSGSAFAVNAMIERDRLEIVAGPGAATDPGGNLWCKDCGCALWGTLPDLFGKGIVFLRAGTLDEGERIVPSAHYFVRSKHKWIVVPDGVPAYGTLPGAGDPPVLDAAGSARVAAARPG